MADPKAQPSHRIFEILGPSFGQLGVVVEDLDASVAAHALLGPWVVYTYDRAIVPGLHIGGEPADFSFRIALNPQRPQLELIEALDDDNPYAIWLSEHGPGLHHLGFYVDDLDQAAEAIENDGFVPLMGGTGFGADGTGGFRYYDTVATVGYIIELIEVPQKRHPPEMTIPLPSGSR